VGILIMMQNTINDIHKGKLKSLIKYKIKVLASLSHELTTPINCSLNMLQLMKNKVNQEIYENYLEPAIISD
jgi:hypothetical protein